MVSSYVWVRSMPKISAFGILASSAFRSQRLGIKSSVASLSVSNSKDQMPRKLTEREMKMRELVHMKPMGYDVLALANPNRYVVGLDISENAVKKARELAASASNAKYLEFLTADFFTWTPSEPFDLLFDYTFFCAVDPSMRPAWANRVAELLKPDGELITLIFPVSEHVGGPPYAVSIPGYEEVLHPVGFEAISIENNKLAIEKRKGREMLGRWKRKGLPHSLL